MLLVVFDVGCLLFVDWSCLSLFDVCSWLLVIRCLLLGVCCLVLFVVCCMFVVRELLFDVVVLFVGC